MERGPGTSWKIWVASVKYALTINGFLKIKDAGKNDEGEYEPSLPGVNLTGYRVHLLQPGAQGIWT